MRIAYQRGLHELGDGLYCYLQPDGTWGWSNAGLIAADGTSLLVDTLFDLELTRAMLDAMRPITDRSPIDAAMNTHGNATTASATSCCRSKPRSTPPPRPRRRCVPRPRSSLTRLSTPTRSARTSPPTSLASSGRSASR